MAIIEQMIEDSFKELLKLDVAGSAPKSGSKMLIHVTHIDGAAQPRISEQELRFLFIRELEKQDQYLYSVETPTAKKYRFKGDGAPKVDEVTGRSGNVDVCIYDRTDPTKPVSLIEFKALNPDQLSYSKDFLKLLCDADNLTNYFVHVINSYSSPVYTIEAKYERAVIDCFARRSDLIIVLCDMRKKTIRQYEVTDKPNLRGMFVREYKFTN